MNLDEFAEAFRQEVLSRSNGGGDDGTSGHFREDAFTEVMIEYLKEANEVEDGEVCYHKNASRGQKLNGFSVSGDGESVDLFVSCYQGKVPPESVAQSEVSRHFRWLRRFLDGALSGSHEKLEDSAPVFDVAQQIYAQRDELTKARCFFLTDGIVKSMEAETETIRDIEIRHHVWDLEKLRRFITSHMQREVIDVDFEKQFGGAIPCLEAPIEAGEYKAFLAFFPGALLANLYDKYGPRLLERNVRSFLQARGKINKGIRATILNEPQRFLAYNNGISAVSETIELSKNTNGTTLLHSARDLQIVNGGQTTASVHHALRKDKANLERMMIQVKLTVLNNPDDIKVFVPLISQYANSQNKVNAADFSANHPFHISVEQLSRRLWAPAIRGTDRQTHWYYERARGSYLDEKSRERTPARIRAFESINPLRQKFTKTDLAKFEATWEQQPHLVCLGAEKNFIKFTTLLAERGYPVADEGYFHRLIAKAILFKAAEKSIGAQGYGGFRAQIVAYTLAWLSHSTAQRIDLATIWKEQKVSDALTSAITSISKYAYDHIVNPPPNRRNPGEWSKREECWSEFREKPIQLPSALDEELLDASRPSNNQSATSMGQDAEADRQVQRVMKVPAETWFNISRWAKETSNLHPWQRSLAFGLGRLAGRKQTPSVKQATQGIKILDECARRGFRAAK